MKVDVKHNDGLSRELNIEIPADTVKAEMDKKFAEVRQTVTLKGFRKGKAPLNMVKSIYGDEVKADVIDQLIKDSYPQAVRDNTIKVASKPTVTALDFTDEGAFTYTASVEVFPDIEKIDYSDLEVPTTEFEVTDDELEKVSEHYRMQFAEFQEVSREATENDVVIADLEKIADTKNALPVAGFPDSKIDLSNPTTVREFREQLPGTKAGDEKEIEVVYADDYSDESFAGAHITYLCKIKSVTERVLPEFDDAFAKRTSKAETALELKLQMREDMKRQKEETLKKEQRREIIRQICEKNEIPVPDGLLEEYLDSMVKDLKKSYPDAEEKELREKYRPVGVNSMRWDILWHELAEQESIEVLPADTEKWMEGFAASSNLTLEQAKMTLSRSGRANQLRESLHEEKVLDFLMEKAKKVSAK
ncbi:MAG: trigger factor [Candidatus Zixiibacteriota bacterium]|nr:MAG: trigger factor [candidate division Zixibacteria bacterium]